MSNTVQKGSKAIHICLVAINWITRYVFISSGPGDRIPPRRSRRAVNPRPLRPATRSRGGAPQSHRAGRACEPSTCVAGVTVDLCGRRHTRPASRPVPVKRAGPGLARMDLRGGGCFHSLSLKIEVY